MKTTLMWTLNDFPAHEIVSGCNTHKKLACPYYIENNKAFTLTNNSKTSFFYYHIRFLSMDHKYRNDFFVGRIGRDIASLLPSGEELYDVMSK